MAAPRSPTIRGTRVPPPSRSRPAVEDYAGEDVEDPQRPRDVVSFALARRAALQAMRRGGWLDGDYCDADPILLRAATYHGEATDRACPVCRREPLREVTWVFGAELGALSGSARSTDQVRAMAREHSRFRVHVVEVCRRCSWNHLVISYTLGDGIPRGRAGTGERSGRRRA